MPQGYSDSLKDTRTFGQQIDRLLRDLNRPYLSNYAVEYLQDAMRYFSRHPFFFTDITNETVPTWQADTNYPQGSTIQFSSGGSTYIAVATNSGKSGAVQPSFSTTIFTPPSGFPPPPSGTAGTTDDNGGPPDGIRWATVENLSASGRDISYWTSLSTVYHVGVYTPPIDYSTPRLVEVTVPSIRYQMMPVSYEDIRMWDAIRPTPVTSYPSYWAWYQQKLYIWPYAVSFYPLTLSYRTSPPLPKTSNDSNFWTTTAEALVRAYARARINQEVIRDFEAAQADFAVVAEELRALQAQAVMQRGIEGIPRSEW